MKTIFVPTDLSPHSLEALRYALQLSKAVMAARLVYYHNYEQPISAEIPVLFTDDLEEILGVITHRMKKELEKCLEEAGMGKDFLKSEVVVTSQMGGDSLALIKNAKDHKAGLIVMGTHGKTGLEKLIFGSITVQVLESSPIPVLAIPPRYRFKPIGKIAFASSLTYFTHEVKTILEFAGDLNAEVEVVHIDYGLLSEKLIAHANRVLDMLDNQKLTLNLVPAIQEKPLKENLLAWLNNSNAEWLVMFPVKREWYQKLLLSSKTLDLAAEFRKPMLIIQKQGD